MHIHVALKEWLENKIEYLDDNNFEALYKDHSYPDILSKGHLTDALFVAGLNPLEYMNYVPTNFANNSQELFQLVLPKHIDHIRRGAFSWSQLREIIINDNCTHINDGAFAYCDWLETIHFDTPSKLVMIGEASFDACVALNRITLPDSLKLIKTNAFGRTSSLEYCSIGKHTTMEEEVFANSKLKSLWFRGTMFEYRTLPKSQSCLYHSNIENIICDDGVITLYQ